MGTVAGARTWRCRARVGSSSSALKAAPLQKDIPNSNEAMIMDFCAVTLEVARDMLRRERNVQVAITNWVSGL